MEYDSNEKVVKKVKLIKKILLIVMIILEYFNFIDNKYIYLSLVISLYALMCFIYERICKNYRPVFRI